MSQTETPTGTELETPPEEQGEPFPGQVTGEQLEAERAERLAEENRPDGAEVDNTGRDFDAEKGMFTDNPAYDATEAMFPPAEEQGS